MNDSISTSTPPNTTLKLGDNPGSIIFKFFSNKKLAWYKRLSLWLMGWEYKFNKVESKDV